MNLPVDAWNLASIRDNIFVYRCKEVTELLSCVMVLKEFLKSHRQVDICYSIHFAYFVSQFSGAFLSVPSFLTGEIDSNRQLSLSLPSRSGKYSFTESRASQDCC